MLTENQKSNIILFLSQEEVGTDYLLFVNPGEDCKILELKDFPEFEKKPLPDKIMEILETTQDFPSVTREGEFYCSPGANRSSGDVWRHLIYFFPEITIFEVLNAVYYLCVTKKVLGVYFCEDIQKRILYRTRAFLEFGENDFDEYGLRFRDWEK